MRLFQYGSGWQKDGFATSNNDVARVFHVLGLESNGTSFGSMLVLSGKQEIEMQSGHLPRASDVSMKRREVEKKKMPKKSTQGCAFTLPSAPRCRQFLQAHELEN